MGPRDVDLTFTERFAAHGTKYLIGIVSGLSDTVSLRFDPRRATVSLSGESEYSGQPFNRGLLVGMVYLVNLLLSMSAIGLASEAATAAADIGPALTAAVFVQSLFVSGVSIIFAVGSIGLMWKTDVIDHTTDPAPDEIQELQEQFVDGEIDEAELGERAAEVWER